MSLADTPLPVPDGMLHHTKSPSETFHWHQLLSTPNPFYVLSAALVLFGIRMSLPASPSFHQAVIIFAILALYTLLLTACTIAVTRILHVWDDARSLLLIHPVLFFAFSSLFDDLLIVRPFDGQLILLIGAIFSIGLSEVVLRILRIKLRIGYRGVYYLILIMLFAYPCILGAFTRDFDHKAHRQVALSLFIPIMSTLFLLLIPAIHKGRPYVEENGTPYGFPLFPMSLFALLMPLVAFRAYWLALAFGPGIRNSVCLEPMAFVPFVFVAGLLLIELGVVTRNKAFEWLSLSVGPVCLFLYSLEPPEYFDRTVDIWAPTLTHTIRLSLLYYSWARVRGVTGSHVFLLMLLAAIGSLDRHGFPGMSSKWHLIPFVTGAIIELAMALKGRSWPHMMSSCFFMSLTAVPIVASHWHRHMIDVPEAQLLWGIVTFAAVWLLFITTLFDRETASFPRAIATLAMIGSFGGTLVLHPSEWLLIAAYIIGLFIYGVLLRYTPILWAGCGGIVLLVASRSQDLLMQLRRTFLGNGLDYLFLGLAFLIAGLVFSAIKSRGVRHLAKQTHSLGEPAE
ncbi:hypothetical protein K2Y11_16990 [bacterium]|nr:hypothetical protein [bacterium]